MKAATQLRYLSLAVAGVLTQGVRAVNVDGNCKYRTYGGADGARLACALGQLIADEEYSEDLEGQGIEREVLMAIYNSQPDLVAAEGDYDFSEPTRDFFRKLQDCHDECSIRASFAPDFMKKAAALAERVAKGEFQDSIENHLPKKYGWDFPDRVLKAQAETGYGKRILEICNTATFLADMLTNDYAIEKYFEAIKYEVVNMSEGPY